MLAVAGYFDGNTCVPFDTRIFKPNQRVIITALDEFVPQKIVKNESVSKILEELTGVIHSDKPISMKEIHAERLEEKYGDILR
ncbi:MAG: hypothetical protein IJP61_00640 [Treponema sp.]|nr:hypothetical protein [Treponema sp.]